ncbi:putative reverse transcriptase domain-containing protein, partial [Tanacetum coccineum]
LGSVPPLPTHETTSVGNAPSNSSYANVTGKPIGAKVNFCTLFTPGGNGIDVVVPMESIKAIKERFVNTPCGFFFGKRVAYPVVANYVRNTWGEFGLVRSMFSSSTWLFSFQFSSMEGLNAMLENGSWFIRNNLLILRKWHPYMNLLKEDVSTVPVWVKLHGVPVTAFSEDGLSAIATKLELKDNIMAAMPKITREGYYTCNIRVEYEWKPPRCACCKVFGHDQEECPKNIGNGEMKNLKKTSQTSKDRDPLLFYSVENDVELGTNRGTSNLASQATNSSGSLFWNVDASSPSTTHVIEKIDKIEKLIIEGKVTLVDDDGKPLEKVASSCDYDSEKRNTFTGETLYPKNKFLAKKDGYGTQSLLEQWTESYENGDYGYDPYDDDMYEGQDIPKPLQAICDKLDITVRGRRKK